MFQNTVDYDAINGTGKVSKLYQLTSMQLYVLNHRTLMSLIQTVLTETNIYLPENLRTQLELHKKSNYYLIAVI